MSQHSGWTTADRLLRRNRPRPVATSHGQSQPATALDTAWRRDQHGRNTAQRR